MKTSSNINARYIGQILKGHNCKTAVIAPGSRNAPIIISLTNDSEYRCLSVPDERAAAFTALGMTIAHKEPVAVICSSGSAAANFYPAVVEAYYQKLPLVVITADRPLEVIDQGVGQTIRQQGIFSQHIVKSVNLLREPKDALGQNYNQRLINEAMHASYLGPVHINVPFDEPLYDTVPAGEETITARIIKRHRGFPAMAENEMAELAEIWKHSPKVMVLVGQKTPDQHLDESLNKLNDASPFLVMAETLSNIDTNCCIGSIDRLIETIGEDKKDLLVPDLLITLGGEVVSKKIKKFFGQRPPAHHWHIGINAEIRDTFGSITRHLDVVDTDFFNKLRERDLPKDAHYRDFWIEVDQQKSRLNDKFIGEVEFSDFLAFATVLDYMPEKSIMHTANSTTVRYAQLFDHSKNILHYANRGTSGIDGCTSTAIGHAMTTGEMVTLISGDVAFLYDSNGFWNDELPKNLRIIILNNNGGNIFRIIEGPDKDASFERFQETVHHVNLKGVADIYGLDFTSVSSVKELKESLAEFYAESTQLKILEVKTPRIKNPEILKNYFKFLKDE